MFPISSIKANKALKLIGPLPGELQSYLFYAAAPMTSTQVPMIANDFIRFLNSTAAKEAFHAAGME